MISKLKKNFRSYFYVQRLYPGTDPLDIIKESEFESKKKILEVNDNVIFIAESLETINDVEDSIAIEEIFDSKNDIIEKASCCNRISYEEFPAGNSLRTIIPAIKSTVKGKKLLARARSRVRGNSCILKNKKLKISSVGFSSSPINTPSVPRKVAKSAVLNSEEKQANHCINIFIPDEVRWRICSGKKLEIKKLQMKIIFNVLRIQSKNNKKVLERLVDNPMGISSPLIGNWNWDEQQKWRGMCSTGIMQSPIDYITPLANKLKKNFSFSMKLKKTHTLIKKNFGEIIVVFLNFAGLLKLEIDSRYILFTPQYMSFRFPGETIMDGRRSMGDMQLHFSELGSNRVNTNINKLNNDHLLIHLLNYLLFITFLFFYLLNILF
jgi:hypothetical protein